MDFSESAEGMGCGLMLFMIGLRNSVVVITSSLYLYLLAHQNDIYFFAQLIMCAARYSYQALWSLL